MEQLDFIQKWDEYCGKFIDSNEYSVEDSVFDAEQFILPEELLPKARKEDVLCRLKFSGKTQNRLGMQDSSEKRLEELADFLRYGHPQLAFDFSQGEAPFLVVKDWSVLKDNEVWCIGDVHGDLLALRSALSFINSNAKRPPVYVFLGDLFDRNPLGLFVLMDVIELIRTFPGRVMWLAGNHDAGLSFMEGRFFSHITPHEFSDTLNDVANPSWNDFVKAVIDFVSKLPIGMVLPNGLLVTHGGVPSRKERAVKNIWEYVNDVPRFISEHRNEFLMNRFCDALGGTKIGSEFSWMELANFSQAVEKTYGVRIQAYLRGHDHCDLCRHEWKKLSHEVKLPPEQQNLVTDILTMTTMVQMAGDEQMLSGFMRHRTSYPSLAKVSADSKVPQCYSLVFDDSEVQDFYSSVNRVYYGGICHWIDAQLKHFNTEAEQAKQARESAAKEDKEAEERMRQASDILANAENEQAQCDKTKKQLETQIATVQKECTLYKDKRTEIERQIDAKKAESDEKEKKKGEIAEQMASLEGKEPEEEQLDKEELQRKIDDLEKRLSELEKRKAQLRNKKNWDAADQIEDEIKDCRNRKMLEEHKFSLAPENKIQMLKDELNAINGEIERLGSEIDSLKAAQQQIPEELENKVEQLRKLQEQENKNADILTDWENKLQDLREQMDGAEAAYNEKHATYEECEKAAEDAQKRAGQCLERLQKYQERAER